MIGRNEGARLIACLDAVQGQVGQIIYVETGSTDGSVAAAKARSAQVLTLDMTHPFTAARARNAGPAQIMDATYVQFLDGDCVLQTGWLTQAQAHPEAQPQVAVVWSPPRNVSAGVGLKHADR